MIIVIKKGRLLSKHLRLSLNYHRLKWGVRSKVTVAPRQKEKISAVMSASKLRNIGIMAHIDAGKTTTTERMLFYAGFIDNPGEVHHGDTVTDFMPQERQRGITIQSAVVTFNWRDTQINLIDTPGHVDFTFEVQRSLRVVDGAVAILDGSAGVEAQTLTVWRQAQQYKLPKIIYLNKMDKQTADLGMCLKEIKEKLKCEGVVLQEPVYLKGDKGASGSGLVGIVDLVDMQRLIFDQSTKGVKILIDDLKENKQLWRKRNELVERISDFDGDLATLIIERESVEKISSEEIRQAIKRVTLGGGQVVPVVLGSSYKNVGVQPLMDKIIDYLPHPLELGDKEDGRKDAVIDAYGSDLCSFAFKSMWDSQLGHLTFTRVFRGNLETGQKIYNVTRRKQEKIAKIYRPFADEIKEVEMVGEGQVVIVSGLKDTFTGDTVTSSSSVASQVARKLGKKKGALEGSTEQSAVLSGVSVPEPVFFCSIEPASLSQQKVLDQALESLRREDPSLHVHVDGDTGQTVLSGMGELHLEIIYDRLKSEYKVEADLGKLQVAYKETLVGGVVKRVNFERRLADRKHFVCLELELVGRKLEEGGGGGGRVEVVKGGGKDKLENLSMVTEKQLRLVGNGVESGLRMGPRLGFPVVGVEVRLNWLEVGRGTSDTIVEAAAAQCLREALGEGNVRLVEPWVGMEVEVGEEKVQGVLDDLGRRRFLVERVEWKHGNKVIHGTAPLSELMGYSTSLRTISSGLATYTMQFSHYKHITSTLDEEKVIKETRGF